MLARADDTAIFVSEKSTSPAVMFHLAVDTPHQCHDLDWEERLCRELATLAQTHARAIPSACCCYGVVAVLRLVLMLLVQLPIASSSLLITCNEKKQIKKGRQKKQRKQRTSGRFFSPPSNFLVGNYGLRRAERWDDMPSMSSEVGEI